jgi:PAS domain S-box-containing protein
MNRNASRPTGIERRFDDDEIIVSKTDPTGRITYANRVFLRVSGYSEAEVLGQPHSIIRHPDMPRCIFKRLWDTIASGEEIFAYVVNLAKNGDHYWVLAHVTPTFDAAGKIVGYHSNRRTVEKHAVETVTPLYAKLRAEEARHDNRKTGMEAAAAALDGLLREKRTPYDEFVLSL